MGEVHRAEDLEAAADSPHRQVAVKTLLRSRTGRDRHLRVRQGDRPVPP
ncbi:hypothetical protein SALBM217S_04432 [Streptomyces griseoloalbus]